MQGAATSNCHFFALSWIFMPAAVRPDCILCARDCKNGGVCFLAFAVGLGFGLAKLILTPQFFFWEIQHTVMYGTKDRKSVFISTSEQYIGTKGWCASDVTKCL